MTFTVLLGSININDGTNYVIESGESPSGQGVNPAAWRNGPMLDIPVQILGSDQDDVELKRRALIAELNAAETSWRYGRESERIALEVALNTTESIFFDVRGGTVDLVRWHFSGLRGWVMLHIECESYAGRAWARRAADVRAASGTLTNGAGEVLIADVDADLPSRARVELVDLSTSGVINRWRLSLVSAASAAVTDWNAWIDVSSVVADVTDATAFNGSFERIGLTSATSWALIGTASMPAGALNKGPRFINARMLDAAAVMAAPTGLTATATGKFASIVKSANANSATGSTTIAASWPSATVAGNTLVAAVKASKAMNRVAITSIADDAGNPGETTITTSAAHGLAVNDKVLIAEVNGNVPDINGTWNVERVGSSTTFNVDTDTTTPGTGGTARETFWETVSAAPTGYVLYDLIQSTEQINEGDETSSRGDPISDPDTITQTKLWVYVNPAASSESSSKTFTFDASVTNRSLTLMEVGGVPSNGGLGISISEQDEAILSPPAGEAGSLYIGIAAGVTQTWAPGFGFTELTDGGGMEVATKYASDARMQPWRAIPSNFNNPVVSALLSIVQDVNAETYQMDAGAYAVRVQAINAAGDEGAATASATPTLTNDGSAIALSWSAPSATSISHYRITVQDPDGNFWQHDTESNATSYTIESLSGWEEVDALPSTSTGSYTASPALVQARVRTSGSATANAQVIGTTRTNRDLLGSWHEVEFGFSHLPLEQQMQDGGQPDWAVDFYAMNAGGATHNISIDAMRVASDESGLTLEYPGLGLATKRTWIAELRADGSVEAWLEDGSGNVVGSVLSVGKLRLAPGDNVLSVSVEQASGVSVITAAQYTVQVTLWPAVDWLVG